MNKVIKLLDQSQVGVVYSSLELLVIDGLTYVNNAIIDITLTPEEIFRKFMYDVNLVLKDLGGEEIKYKEYGIDFDALEELCANKKIKVNSNIIYEFTNMSNYTISVLFSGIRVKVNISFCSYTYDVLAFINPSTQKFSTYYDIMTCTRISNNFKSDFVKLYTELLKYKMVIHNIQLSNLQQVLELQL